MTIDEIRELIQLVKDTGVAELEVQRSENRVRIRLGSGEAAPTVVQTGSEAVLPPPSPTPPPAASEPNELLVKSPIVGTFYESAGPGSPPFVRIGETVQPGKVLCIIESMKLMNEIEAEVGGVIASKLVQNGQPVEYGEALFAIRPL